MRSFVFSNVFIAVSAALFTHQTYLLLDVEEWSFALLALVFFSTLLVYNLDRVAEGAAEDVADATRRHEWIDEHRTLLWALTVVAIVGIAIAAVFVPTRVLLSTAPLGVVALGYSLPIFGRGDRARRLKEVAGLKMVLIVVVWAGATAFLPALEALETPFQPAVGGLVAERALFIFAITLPFDVRDLERDRAGDVRTIPMLIGVEWTRRLALASMALFAGLAAILHGPSVEGAAIPLVASAAVTACFLGQSYRNRDEMFYVGILDGMIALQWGVCLAWLELTA